MENIFCQFQNEACQTSRSFFDSFKMKVFTHGEHFLSVSKRGLPRQPIAVSDISNYICLIDIRDGSSNPVYGGVVRLQALSSAKTGCKSHSFMN